MAAHPLPEAELSVHDEIGDYRRDLEAHPPQLPSPTDKIPWIVRHLSEDVKAKHADLIFLFCYFLSGLCDSTAYRAWGCFVSMQTGNTIFLGLGTSNTLEQTTYDWLKSLVSILSFLAGSSAYSKTRYFRPQSRSALVGNFGSQCLILITAASMLQLGVIEDSNKEKGVHTLLKLIPLALVAFQCAGQMAASRLLEFPELPTTMLTSLYYDLVADPGIFRPLSKNTMRNRRVTAIIGVIGGATIGGWLFTSTGRVSTALWVAAASKLVISAIWFFWKQENRNSNKPHTAADPVT
ncbi:hypothetical protein GX48_08114 [Paracoccidioides brasiliensis]|nr:hypothetical protein GX48_08114 [Paracoccidioides brasiliensis]